MSLLEMTGIGKSFSGVRALHDAGFTVRAGEIHALLGANGAGKSTLMKILSGAYEADEGTIRLEGRDLILRSPADAKAAGIHCVYQEVDTSLVAQLSVAENIFLDRMMTARQRAWVKWRDLYSEAEKLLAELGLDVPVRKKVADLTLAEKQLVLIARVMVEEAKVVIFDEPTAPLSLEETDQLFRIMDKLKKSGIGLVFISHRLHEVFQICDRATVMRDGRMIVSEPTAGLDTSDIIHAMLGRSLDDEYPKQDVPIGEVLLSVKGLSQGNRVRSVDLDVRRGEIVAVVGLVGAGKTELSRLLFGVDEADGGTVAVASRNADLRAPADAVNSGIVLVPEERRKEGILVKESVLHNLSLPILGKLSRWGVLSGRQEKDNAAGVIERLGIKTPSASQLTGFLSGGNQQKVAIGKWLNTAAEVFVLDEPTKGVDIGAKRDIFLIIGELAAQGKGILYLTCEFAEALGLADRILVMCDGRIVKQFLRGEATQENLLYYASAGQEELA
ncbi:sugar ABC transporter ATP-binding protein [Cohnella fermenti]|uniref:Sugar ABC transporter ATP-binding protein n=1 Tax=Cohnella fermenti TaxID=2565925 RepID=A0A4S4BTS3_9BACL|nr:sugar ABC transporter ATP-binding protein [Cohnella fermenti]THF78476.1 sugar ABC transporter ATP-binding protein [Cohnella fermenti]